MATSTKPSALVDTHVIYCGDNLDQLKKLPATCVEFPENSPALQCWVIRLTMQKVPSGSKETVCRPQGDLNESHVRKPSAEALGYYRGDIPRFVALARVLEKSNKDFSPPTSITQ